VQLSSGSLAPAAPHIKAGTLRCLAVSAQNRWPDLPDVPTMQELGYKDFVFPTDCALMAPAKTPPEYVRGQVRTAGKDDEGVCRPRPLHSGQV
jgi:tripartite-type tricarboxylate transporter receptor subunit TctC